MYHIDEENSDVIFEVNGNKVALKILPVSGEGGGSLIYLIKKGDLTTPTDKNTFSALRILAEIANNNEGLKGIYLRKDQPDITNHLTGFNAGITIGESKKQLLDIIRLSDLDISPSDTSVYTSLSVDTIITALEDKYIRKDQPDSTGYLTGFNAGITIGINKKSFLDIIRTTDTDTALSDTNV